MRTPAAIVVLVCAVAAPAARAEDFKEGDKVDILWNGKWYPGVVLKTGDGKVYVHYDNYGSNWDAWVGVHEVRRGGQADAEAVAKKSADADAAAAAARGDPVVGERCEASWSESWYEIEILEVKDGKFFVHWRGYPKESDEWIARDRIRRKGEDKEVMPRKGREGNGGGVPPAELVGREVEVFWHGKWWAATVLKTDGTRFWIRYANTGSGTSEEWAVKERVREVGGASRVRIDPQDVPGTKGLSGLWWRTYQLSGRMHDEQFTFFPDGRLVHRYHVKNPDAPDFEAIRREHPEALGAYGIADGKLRIVLGGDADDRNPMTFEVVDDDRMKLNGIPTFRAKRFPRGTRIEGAYLNITARGISDQNRSESWAWNLHADGTFEHEKTTSAFDPGGGSHQAVKSSKGTYVLEGNHFTFTIGGVSDTYVVYPMGPDEAPNSMLFLGWEVLRLRDAK